MEFIKFYNSQINAVNDTIATPAIISVSGVNTQLYMPTDAGNAVTLSDDTIIENSTEKQFVKYSNVNENHKIYYTSSTGKTLNNISCLGSRIVSHVNIGNKCCITCKDTITNIGIDAFLGCAGITDINLPTTVTSIAKYAFMNCEGLTSIIIPDGIEKIGYYAFKGCTNLKSVIYKGETYTSRTEITTALEDSNVTLDDYVFSATGLPSLTDSSSSSSSDSSTDYKDIYYTTSDNKPITTSLSSEFDDNDYYEKTNIYENGKGHITFTGDTIPSFSQSNTLTSVALPDFINAIDFQAFYGCSNLSSVTYLEKTYTSIWELTEALMAENVEIGYEAFAKTNLDGSYDYSSGNYRSIDNNDLIYTTSDNLIITPNVAFGSDYKHTYKNNVGTITQYGNNGFTLQEKAFYNCTTLTTIDINDWNDMTTIGASAFEGCTNLISVKYNDTVYTNATELIAKLELDYITVGDDAFLNTGLTFDDNSSDDSSSSSSSDI